MARSTACMASSFVFEWPIVSRISGLTVGVRGVGLARAKVVDQARAARPALGSEHEQIARQYAAEHQFRALRYDIHFVQRESAQLCSIGRGKIRLAPPITH